MLLRYCLWILSIFALCVCAEERKASNADDVMKACETLAPGDVLILTDGEWKDQGVVIKGKGTAEKPITFRAATSGKVIFSGNSSLLIDGEHLVVSGLQLKDCTAEKDGIAIKGSHNRVTDCAVIG